MKFTLDNNCIIAVEKSEPESASIRALVSAHIGNSAEVAVLGISASERQPGGGYLKSIADFHARLERAGVASLTIYKPTGIYDVTFWDWSVFVTPESAALERRIHDAMFQPSEFDWSAVAGASGEDVQSTTGPAYRKWRNRRCDVQGLLAHITNSGDVFVTSDGHFLDNATTLLELGAGRIATPSAAAAMT